MRLGFLRDVYERPGPFAAVYLDTSGDTENAPKQTDLRWRSARQRLAEQQVGAETLQAIEDMIGRHEWHTGRRGQVLVAADGAVLFADELPCPPSQFSEDELVHSGPAPHLLPYLWLRGARIPYVVAVVDHTGGEVRSANAAYRTEQGTTVQSGGYPVHKNHGGGDGDLAGHHHAVEEQWLRTAGQVAEEIDRQAMVLGADVIVLAGDVQQRKLVHDKLHKGLQDRAVATEASHRDRKASDESLHQEVSEVIESTLHNRVTDVVREFEQERGQQDRAVEGWQEVVQALQRGQVRTVLRDPAAGVEAGDLWIGPTAGHIASEKRTLTEMGVDSCEEVHADAALIRALVGTDAELVFPEEQQVTLTHGIGAVLRYTDSGGAD